MALIAQPPWWAYVIMVPCVFFLCLLLNYIVNRINAARIEERYAQLIAKDSSNQGTQSQQETIMRMETPKRDRSSPTCLQTVQTHPIEVARVFPAEEQHDSNVESRPVAETVFKKTSDVVSTSQVINITSNPIFLRKVYNFQLDSSKSLEKQNVIPKQETQEDTDTKIFSEIRKKAKDCESMPAFKRMMNDQYENKSRDCVSDTAITICDKEIKKDTNL